MLNLLVKLSMESHMGLANSIFKMMTIYKALLLMGVVKAKEELSKLMEAIMKDKLKIMKLMVMGNIMMLMDTSMKVNGKIICPMEWEKPLIQMEVDT